jgi:hypothetical protein
VWLVDRASGRPALLESVRVANDAGLAALRAVELVRARLLDVPSAERAPTAPATPRERFDFDLGPGVLAGAGGVPPALVISVGARWNMNDTLGVRAFALMPTVAPHVAAPEGTASISTTIGAAALEASLLPPASEWSARVGGGVAIAWLHMEGSGTAAPYAGHADDVASLLPFASIGAGRALAPQLRIAAAAWAGAAVPQPAVRFAGREVATWGRPSGGGSLALEIGVR